MSDAVPKEVEALSDRQLRQFRSVFQSFDKGGSGSISRFDVGQGMRVLGLHPTDAELKKLVDDGGGAATGKVDFMQFAAIVARSLAALRNVPSLARAFAHFDPLAQGFVSAQTFRDIFETVGEIPIAPEAVDDLLAFADPEETGQIYYEAFLQRVFTEFANAKAAKEAAVKK